MFSGVFKRKHQQKLKLGERTKDFNIYKDINKDQVITQVALNDSVNVEELWLVQSKKDSLHMDCEKMLSNAFCL